ncbi:hypothetical protein N8I77_009692 [Diaporthe amygdali]|uniref:C2H2-type domain-containing protein n=1 Tax=Phomopsis amygdali TaxID=1214568 RepID=A0AAD9SD56_PHOAM|nr:hypothetical protein N8I77_009692 [Diaporthe amygdali]
MENHTNFAPYNMALDNIDPSEIDQLLQQMQWEQSIDQQFFAAPEYETTNFDPSLSPLSGFASPSSMTTGSTNQSPLVPTLDYDMSCPVNSFLDEASSLFPELMDSAANMQAAWMGHEAQGCDALFQNLSDGQAKAIPASPVHNQLYPTGAPETTIYQNDPVLSPYLTAEPPATTYQTSPPTPSSSLLSSSQQPTTDLTCSHCGATFTDKTKLKVHTNKHTKPFRCSAVGCDYATAEKKSLQRHLLARSKWDGEHGAAAQRQGVMQVRHRCPRQGCTYTTIREDNLKRHIKTCGP